MKKAIFLFLALVGLEYSYSQDECNCKGWTPVLTYASTFNMIDKTLSNEVKFGIWGKGHNPIELLVGVKQIPTLKTETSTYISFKLMSEIGIKAIQTPDFLARVYAQTTVNGNIYNGVEFDYIFENEINIGVHYITDYSTSKQVGLNITFPLK